jgi:recombinational DNA repair protein (RecF pathway)
MPSDIQHSRREVDACARCGEPDAPYAYLHDGEHYCIRCARVKLVVDQVRPAGRRDGDLTLEDVLFTELP